MRQPGFTLLEVVVVLVITGLLVAGIGQGARLGLTAWSAQGRLDDTGTTMEAVDRSLRLFVENLAPGDETPHPPVTGTASTLSGITRLPVLQTGLTPMQVEAALALSGDRLVLRWRPFRHGPSVVQDPVQEAPLMDGVASLAIAYWQPPSTWTSAWTNPDLPMLVRIRIRLKNPSARPWPDLVMAPMLARP